MRTFLKWTVIVLAGFLALVVVLAIAMFVISNSKMNQEFEIETAELTIPTDAESIAEGERQVSIRGCADCHTANFGGQLFVDDQAFGKYYATNITPGEGSAVTGYTPADWDRAIRHGVNKEGKPILIMPSTDYYRISNEHTGMMIAYLQTLDPVDQSWPDSQPGPLARALVAAGQLPFPAEVIDHSIAPPEKVTAEVSAAYGTYLADTCTGCHRPDFSGGPMVGAAPTDPPPANLTPAGHLANWTEADFINTLRTGVTPEGKVLDPQYMPWPITTLMTDDELSALWLHFQSLPAVETEG